MPDPTNLKQRRDSDKAVWNGYTTGAMPLDGKREPDSGKALWDAYTTAVKPLDSKRAATIPATPIPAVQPAPTGNPGHLDLHGLTVAQAHAATKGFLASAAANHRAVTIITGLSGEIKREFPHWFEDGNVRTIEEINGGGGYRIRFKRRRK